MEILRRPAVERKVGLSTTQIYTMMSAGEFPRPIKLAPKAVGWVESEIDEWLQARVENRDTGVQQ